MPRRSPDWRLRAVKSATKPPEDALERALYSLLKTKETDNEPVAYAAEIYTRESEREIMQAWLLAGATDGQIQENLSVPQDATQAYRELFFDVTAFRDRLDMLSWVGDYHKVHGGTPYGARLLQTAMTRGVDTLRWLFGPNNADVDPNLVLQNAMSDAYYRGKSNRDYALSSKEAGMAHNFMNTAVKIATQLSKEKPPDANALVIKLRYRDMTESVEGVADKADLMH